MGGKTNPYFASIRNIHTLNMNYLLRTKLRFENNFNRNNRNIMMKSVRATFILIPIFGLQFLLLPMRPKSVGSLSMSHSLLSWVELSLAEFELITLS